MQASTVTSVNDFQGLNALRVSAQQQSPAALTEAAIQFEALFIGEMLKSARQASFGDGIFDSQQTQQYLAMMDQQVALEMARSGGYGFGDQIVRGMEKLGAGGYPTPDAFVADIWPHARVAGQRLGVDPEVLVAQAALETGWGESIMQRPDGRPSFNFFGIKADAKWHGDRVLKPTLEFRDGVPERVKQPFRAYASAADGFADYTRLIGGSARYGAARASSSDARAYAHALQDAGYATDPDYAKKLLAVFAGDQLRLSLDGLKGGGLGPTQ
jgi:flagellar protein FlgJ